MNDKITGGTLTAPEWNEAMSELQNVIEALGITLSSGDLNQLGKAIAGYVANGTFYSESGIADAYVLTTIGSKQSLTAYTDGATFEFTTTNANTGASTVNVAGLGVKNIKLSDGTDPAAGQIDGRTLLKFDSANDRAELIISGSVTTTVVTVSGAYNPPASVKSLKFTAIGGGGGGGGTDGQGVNTAAIGAGGGGGGASIKITNSIEASYTLTIGAGGAGGAAGANNGAPGGNTTVVSTDVNLTSNGGGGGAGMLGTGVSFAVASGLGGTSTGGDLNPAGNDGSTATVVLAESANPGDSGGSILGGGKRGVNDGGGLNGSAPGAGGGGAGSLNTATNRAGGSGADGVIIIEEFF